jgi:MFS family permease
VRSRAFSRALRLRLVSRAFSAAVVPAVFASGLVESRLERLPRRWHEQRKPSGFSAYRDDKHLCHAAMLDRYLVWRVMGRGGGPDTAPLLVMRRVAGRTLILISCVAAAVVYVGMYFAGFENLVVILVFIFLTGLTLGIFLVVQATMIADAVDDAELRLGVRNDGISFATLTFVSKIMNALAVLVFGVFVVITGYENGVVVTSAMQNTIFVSITIVPAVSCVLSAVPFLFYRLGGPRVRVVAQ